MHKNWTVTLRIDTSNWSANREYPATNILPGGTGHAWLTVTSPNGARVDLGYYPVKTALIAPGQLRADDAVRHQHNQDAAYTYKIDADQASRMLTAAESIRAHPGEYNFLNHNC